MDKLRPDVWRKAFGFPQKKKKKASDFSLLQIFQTSNRAQLASYSIITGVKRPEREADFV